MIEPGGVYDSNDIKILVLYTLDQLKITCPRNSLTDILLSDGLVNFFDAQAAIEELKALGHVLETQDEKLCLQITELGRLIVNTLSKKLKYSVREKASKAAHKIESQLIRSEYVSAEYFTVENGFLVDLAFFEHENEPFLLRLTVPTQDMAAKICQNFKEKAESIVLSVSGFLMNNEKS